MKVPLGLAGIIGGGFEGDGDLGLVLAFSEHDFVGVAEGLGGGFTADGNVSVYNTQAVERVDFGLDDFAEKVTGNIDDGHRK